MSALGRHIRKLADREGLNMANTFMVSLCFATPAATETAQFTLPVDAMLISGSSSLSDTGTTSGSTTIGIDNSTQSVTDLDGDGLDIAYDASPKTSSSDILNGMTALEGNAGDIYLVTVDAVPGGGTPLDLNINLLFKTL